MIIDKYYDYGVGIEEWSIITENEEEYFDNEEEAREFWNSLSEKERKSGQYFRKSYFINEDGEFEEDEVEITRVTSKGNLGDKATPTELSLPRSNTKIPSSPATSSPAVGDTNNYMG